MKNTECPKIINGCDSLMTIVIPKDDGFYGNVDVRSQGRVIRYDVSESRGSGPSTSLGSVIPAAGGETVCPWLLPAPNEQYAVNVVAVHETGYTAVLSTALASPPQPGMWYQGFDLSGQNEVCAGPVPVIESSFSRAKKSRK